MKPFFTLCLGLFWLSTSLMAQSSTFNEAVIHPELMAEMETQAQNYLPVYILLADRVDVSAMDADFQKRQVARQARVPQLLQALQVA